MENDKDKNQVNEPSFPYNKIYFFKSFEEMEYHNAKEMAMLTPLQHLQNVTSLIQKIFAKELKGKNNYTIHFKK
jgi:hypothetical protein